MLDFLITVWTYRKLCSRVPPVVDSWRQPKRLIIIQQSNDNWSAPHNQHLQPPQPPHRLGGFRQQRSGGVPIWKLGPYYKCETSLWPTHRCTSVLHILCSVPPAWLTSASHFSHVINFFRILPVKPPLCRFLSGNLLLRKCVFLFGAQQNIYLIFVCPSAEFL